MKMPECFLVGNHQVLPFHDEQSITVPLHTYETLRREIIWRNRHPFRAFFRAIFWDIYNSASTMEDAFK